MGFTIESERPDSPDACALIGELDATLNPLYAPEDRHGYDVTQLLQAGVQFAVIRQEGVPAGCGAVHLFDATSTDAAFGELKRMYVRPQFRGLGLGRRLVEHFELLVRQRGISVLRLETGVHQKEAIGLYETMGFYRIEPFGHYRATDVSMCYEKRLSIV